MPHRPNTDSGSRAVLSVMEVCPFASYAVCAGFVGIPIYGGVSVAVLKGSAIALSGVWCRHVVWMAEFGAAYQRQDAGSTWLKLHRNSWILARSGRHGNPNSATEQRGVAVFARCCSQKGPMAYAGYIRIPVWGSILRARGRCAL